MKSYRFIVSGRVQGVWYRASVQKNAQKLDLSGYIKNLDDGSVEAVVSCTEERLEEFKAVLKKGSPLSRVKSIMRSEVNGIFDGRFSIR